MFFFPRRIARLRQRIEFTLSRAQARYNAPEPLGRDQWLREAKSVQDLWFTLRSPMWAVHLAWHTGTSLPALMHGGTRAFAQAAEGFVNQLPTVTDYGYLQPKERPITDFFDWTDQPLDDLSEGAQCYGRAAADFRSHLAALVKSDPEGSPYRDLNRLPPDAATKLYLLEAGALWFEAVGAASQKRPRKAAACEALGAALGNAWMACGSTTLRV